MADRVLAEVRLWGMRVGAVLEDPSGTITFEYDADFRSSGLEISPLRLPLSTLGPVQFPDLRKSESFLGLPGVLADSLPDRFGNAVIQRYFEEKGTPDKALSPVQRLLYVGRRAMGALEFLPPLQDDNGPGEQVPLEIANLVDQARGIIQGKTEIAVPEIMRVGASAGGMRPKALILWNPGTEVVRSGSAPMSEGDQHWLIKFDGVPPAGGDVGTSTSPEAPQPFMRIEYTYSRIARKAGLSVPETRLLRERGYAHFMVRRFDRLGTERLHQHSLGGMLHLDYNIPQASSYEEYLRTVMTLGMGAGELEEAFRRAAFNIVGVNQDDHVKNLTFLMDGTGGWHLSPAYDLTFARGHGWTRTHQMTLGGKADNFVPDDLEALGRKFGIRRTRAIQDQVREAFRDWEEEASDAGVENSWIDAVAAELDRRGLRRPPAS